MKHFIIMSGTTHTHTHTLTHTHTHRSTNMCRKCFILQLFLPLHCSNLTTIRQLFSMWFSNESKKEDSKITFTGEESKKQTTCKALESKIFEREKRALTALDLFCQQYYSDANFSNFSHFFDWGKPKFGENFSALPVLYPFSPAGVLGFYSLISSFSNLISIL